jgi:hypothetical protein
VSRTSAERSRQEALFGTGSATRSVWRRRSPTPSGSRATRQSRGGPHAGADAAAQQRAGRGSRAPQQGRARVAGACSSSPICTPGKAALAGRRSTWATRASSRRRRRRRRAAGPPGPAGVARHAGPVLRRRDAWVQANFRETQLTNIKVGDPVDVRIDVYPGE